MAWVSLNDALQTVAITKGGTGLTAQPQLATNLASTSTAGIFQASPRPGVVGTLPVANGGTGKTSGTCYMATTLYTNNTGNTGTVTLSDSAANYEIMDVFFMTNDDMVVGCQRVLNPNGTRIPLSCTYFAGSVIYFKARAYTVSGTAMTPITSGGERKIDSDGKSLASPDSNNYIKIFWVLGYK